MVTAILGRRRQGKSTLAYSLALAHEQTILVFDPNSQFNALARVEDVEAFFASGERAGRIVPDAEPETAWEALANELDGGAWRWGEYTLIVDECSVLMSPSWIDPLLERYIRTAPADVHLILTTHRAVDVHPLIRALASDWLIFQTHLVRDLKNMEDHFGADVAAKARALRPYHAIHYWLDSGGVPRAEVWSNPAEWYVEIGRVT